MSLTMANSTQLKAWLWTLSQIARNSTRFQSIHGICKKQQNGFKILDYRKMAKINEATDTDLKVIEELTRLGWKRVDTLLYQQEYWSI